jgi:hypothetical protein
MEYRCIIMRRIILNNTLKGRALGPIFITPATRIPFIYRDFSFFYVLHPAMCTLSYSHLLCSNTVIVGRYIVILCWLTPYRCSPYLQLRCVARLPNPTAVKPVTNTNYTYPYNIFTGHYTTTATIMK